jgi:Rad3-related DNA helicase
MIEIFMQATDFNTLFEQNLDEEDKKETSEGVYWERVFANATSDAHKLFKSQKNKMFIETFEDTLRKILRYRNAGVDSDNKYRTDGAYFKYDYNDFIAILYEDIIEDYTKAKKTKGRLTLKKVRTLGFWCFNAGNSFRQIMSLKPRSVILTSGTLAPIDSFEKELQTPFKYKLEAKHVIDLD